MARTGQPGYSTLRPSKSASMAGAPTPRSWPNSSRFSASRCQRGATMSTATTRFLRRDPAQVTPWAETCGQIRCLIEESDGAAGEVHQVQIQDAKLHYHERTDEFYYVIAGN